MQILLKSLLKEVEESNPLQVQVYVDLDGVLADMEKGFKKISGGYTSEELLNTPEIRGNKQLRQRKFWQLINRSSNFWLNLDIVPDAKILWKFVKENFTNPPPVVLSAGQGAPLIQQKTEWVHKNFGPDIKVIIASSGVLKSNYLVKFPPEQRVTHVLIDDMQRNVDAWDNPDQHRVGILFKDAASVIKQLSQFLPQK